MFVKRYCRESCSKTSGYNTLHFHTMLIRAIQCTKRCRTTVWVRVILVVSLYLFSTLVILTLTRFRGLSGPTYNFDSMVVPNSTRPQSVVWCIPGSALASSCGSHDTMFSVANTSCTTADSYLELPNHCQTVLDLTCHHFAKRAVYHRLIDCFLAEFVLLNYTIHNYPQVCAVGCGKRDEFYHFFDLVAKENSAERIFNRESNCIVVPNGSRVILNPALQGDFNSSDKNIQQLTAFIDDRYADLDSEIGVLLVERLTTRNFHPNTSYFMRGELQTLSKSMSGKLIIYHGNETIRETIIKFRSANVVVMYHGAAAANLIFCRARTIAVEFTTYHDVQEKHRWRANFRTIRALRPDLRLLTYHLPFRTVYPNINHSLNDVEDTDHFIKDLYNVHIPKHVMDNVLGTVELLAQDSAESAKRI